MYIDHAPFIRVVLLLCGVATTAMALAAMRGVEPASQQVQLLTLATGIGLILAAALPAIRLPALGAALLVKLSYLAAWWASGAGELAGPAIEATLVAALAGLAAVVARDSRREARWNGGESFRLES